ncbi:MAG TPA: hypothetical protein VKV39_20440 [Candidatus Sulfotelmatobacter sp.]|nr:hypothetical protein [Candidatus Sulfotelmatobacter sp.]
MDILAHALWTAGAALLIRRRLRRTLSPSWAVFWGVFPDLFSFAVPAVVRIWWYLSGTTSSLLPDAHGPQHFRYVWTLYYASHSLLVFGVVFGVVWILAKRPVLEMSAWCLHILIDIPTHQGIFALHFLWPLSSYAVSGIRWESHWFIATNYGALFLLYSWMWLVARRRRISVASE